MIDSTQRRPMTSVRILVVADDPSAGALLTTILEDDGYRVCVVANDASVPEAALSFQPDLALVEGSHSVDIARRLRQVGNLPIIFVTAASTAADIHSGFRMGADDYIVKPFDAEELSWRVRAALRRSGHGEAQVWECGDLILNERTRSVSRGGSPVPLTAMEFTLLGILLRNRTCVVTKRQIRSQVWGYDADDHLIEVHISALRRKLEAHGVRMIQTVRGIGYVLHP